MEGSSDEESISGEILRGTSEHHHTVENVPTNLQKGSNGIVVEERSSSPCSNCNSFSVNSQITKHGSIVGTHEKPFFSENPFQGNHQSNGNLEFADGDMRASVQNSLPLHGSNQSNGNLVSANGNIRASSILDYVQVSYDQPLMEAFNNMNIQDAAAISSVTPLLVENNLSSQDLALLIREHYATGMNMSHSYSGIDPVQYAMPEGANLSCLAYEAHPPLIRPNGSINLNGDRGFNYDADLYKLNVHGSKQQQPGSLLRDFGEQRLSLAPYAVTVPLNHGMHNRQFLPGAPIQGVDLPNSSFQQQHQFNSRPIQGVEIPNSPFQQQYHFNSRSIHHVPSQPLDFTTMTQLDTEERNFRLHQQSNYGQLQNKVTGVHQIQQGVDLDRAALSGDTIRSFQESYWDNIVDSRYNQLDHTWVAAGTYNYGLCACGENCRLSSANNLPPASDLSYSAEDYVGYQDMDRIHKQLSPESILTRSHGMNSLKPIRCRRDQSSLRDERIARFFDGDIHQPVFLSERARHLDSRWSQASFPSNADTRHASKSLQVKYNSIVEVRGSIYLLAKDQHGCRSLQKTLSSGNSADIKMIFAEIIGHILDLMGDNFGNYLVQKLLDVCTEEQRMHVLRELTNQASNLIDISCDNHGTRAVQKLIETLKCPEQYCKITSSLKHGIMRLLIDSNGNHVAHHCLQHLPSEYNEFIFDAAAAHVVELAQNSHGCCMLQKCLDHANQRQKQRLITNIASNALLLAQDLFGNYVVQCIVRQNIQWATSAIIGQLEGNFAALSMQKCGSHVVERCLNFASDHERENIIRELMYCHNFIQIVQNEFGNFVIQCALNESKGTLHANLVRAILPHVRELRTSPYGKRVLSSACFRKYY